MREMEAAISHSQCCLVLMLTKRLYTQGFRNLLPSEICSLSMSALCRVCDKVVAHLWPQLHATLQRMASELDISLDLPPSIDVAPSLSCCNIELSHRSHGRCIIATHDISFGSMLLEESPALICLEMHECNCHISPILPQHLTQAMQAHDANEDLWLHLTSGMYEPSPLCIPHDARDRYWSSDTVLMICFVSAIVSHLHPLFRTVTIANILSRLPLNTHAVSTVGVYNGQTEQRRVALCLYSLASAANHSCSANAAVSFPMIGSGQSQPVIRLSAVRDIRAGEEICICYGATPMMFTLRRRQLLQEQYLFHCECVSCANFDTLLETPHAIAEEQRRSVIAKLSKLRELYTLALDMEAAAEIHRAVRILERILAAVHETVQSFSAVDKKQMLRYEWYYDLSAMHWHVLDMLARIACNSGDYVSGIKYVRSSVDGMIKSGYISKTDIVVAREQVKIAELEDIMGRRRIAQTMARDLLHVMRPYVTDIDPDVTALQHILQ